MGYVYKITNTRNNKSYIGISIHEPTQGRIKHHLSGHGNQCIASAVKKYGQNAFVYEVLEADVFDEFLPDLEIAYIAEFNTVAPHGYNLTRGGNGSGSTSEQTRRRISAALKGKKYKTGRNRGKRKPYSVEVQLKIGAVAYLFITEPEKTVKEIANTVGIHEYTVHQWRANGEWDKALDAFNFTGDRSLSRSRT